MACVKRAFCHEFREGISQCVSIREIRGYVFALIGLAVGGRAVCWLRSLDLQWSVWPGAGRERQNSGMGTYSRLNRPIHVVAYDARWLVLFKAESVRLLYTLGSKMAAMQHIGSTAVDGKTHFVEQILALARLDRGGAND